MEGARAWLPMSRGSFPMWASVNSMLRVACGAILIGGRFPVNSVQVIDYHSLGIYTAVLLPLLSFFAKMTVLPWLR